MAPRCVQLLCTLAVFVAILAVYFPTRHARHYVYISPEDAVKEIVLNRQEKIPKNLPNCSYNQVLLTSKLIDINEIGDRQKGFITPKRGGEYEPSGCIPMIKSAIIIPYRNRSEQLNIFLNYMHKFLQQQNIHYKIIVVEQNDTLPFNRAKMINFGAQYALGLNYTCLILHDVDLIPLTTGNLYGCTYRPRHMSSSLDTFRYNLPYLTLFGGAISILSNQFQSINGMSNLFYGWGGEDDDFYKRLEAINLLPYRFAPELSKYTMLMHKKQQVVDNKRFDKLENSLENMSDGLSSLNRKYSVYLEDLYTKVVSF
ncbi:beta-1,4-galactosyltransferase 1 [Anthonomus grandis grandis]|uniref:beta-1,4-galactosyltransferase 1 n=1 Tax=Anthonomus grandis grandis TaxID=2921223 RepID=UPI0021663740|nr:beta-1,4-galactosyltransferase 1 [Anthonomus grandis grandis]